MPQGMDLRSVIERAAERHPERVALHIPETDETYTCRELVEEARRVAEGLRDRFAADTGTTLGIYAPNAPSVFVTLLAAWLRGQTVCEIKPRTSPENLPYYVEDGEVDVLFVHPSRMDRVEAARDDMDVDGVVQMEGTAPGWAVSMENLKGEPEQRAVSVAPETVASIGYTSGTTGRPKGVPQTHDAVFHTTLILLIRNEVVEKDRVCLIYPYYGVGTLEFLASLMVGATIILPDDPAPENVAQIIEDEEITSIGGVPTQLKGLAGAVAERGSDTSSLRYVHTGSGLMTEAVYEQVKTHLCETVCTSYGSSEAGETTYSLEDSISIGRPQPFQRIRLVAPGEKDPEKIVEGGPGELIVDVRGPTVFDGYWRKPEKTAEAVVDGWYFTDDIVTRDDEGMLWFQGRDDDIIVSGGENIAPGEVEDALLRHEDVVHAGVIGVPDEKWGEKVVAYVEVSGDVSRDELDAHCRESALEDFKRPKEYVFVDEMPLTKTGGVKRAELRSMWAER